MVLNLNIRVALNMGADFFKYLLNSSEVPLYPDDLMLVFLGDIFF